VLPVTIIIKQ